MNRMQIVGRLTADPEVKKTSTGIDLCTFTVAVARRGNREEADFIPVTVWREAAVNCNKFLIKGNQVGVCGALQLRRYEDKEGIKRTAVDLQADEVEFLTPKADNASQGTAKKARVEDLDEVDSSQMPF